MDFSGVGRQIRAMRKRSDRPVKEIVFGLDITRQTLNNWERAEPLPSLPELVRLADALGHDVRLHLVDRAANTVPVEVTRAAAAIAEIIDSMEPVEQDSILMIVRALARLPRGKRTILARALQATARLAGAEGEVLDGGDLPDLPGVPRHPPAHGG